MAEPISPSVRAGSPPGIRETIPQAQEHRDRNTVVPHTYATYYADPHQTPPSAWGCNDRQLGCCHPPAWHNSSGSLHSHPQSVVPVQHDLATMNQIPPSLGRADHQTPHPALQPVVPPPAYDRLTAQWKQKHPSDQTNANHTARRLLSEYDHRSAPQLPASLETPNPPAAEVITEQISFRSVEDGADKIGELVIEEMAKTRAYFEGLIMEMRNQLASEQEEKESLKKRVHELEAELQQLKKSKRRNK